MFPEHALNFYNFVKKLAKEKWGEGFFFTNIIKMCCYSVVTMFASLFLFVPFLLTVFFVIDFEFMFIT